MGRSAADASLMMAAQAGFDSCDPFSTPVDGMSFRTPQPVDLGRLRVAYTEDLGFAPVDNDIRAAFRSKVRSFKGLFRECVEATPELGDANDVFEVLRAVGYLARSEEQASELQSLMRISYAVCCFTKKKKEHKSEEH